MTGRFTSLLDQAAGDAGAGVMSLRVLHAVFPTGGIEVPARGLEIRGFALDRLVDVDGMHSQCPIRP